MRTVNPPPGAPRPHLPSPTSAAGQRVKRRKPPAKHHNNSRPDFRSPRRHLTHSQPAKLPQTTHGTCRGAAKRVHNARVELLACTSHEFLDGVLD